MGFNTVSKCMGGHNIQRNIQTDIVTYKLNQTRGRLSENHNAQKGSKKESKYPCVSGVGPADEPVHLHQDSLLLRTHHQRPGGALTGRGHSYTASATLLYSRIQRFTATRLDSKAEYLKISKSNYC